VPPLPPPPSTRRYMPLPLPAPVHRGIPITMCGHGDAGAEAGDGEHRPDCESLPVADEEGRNGETVPYANQDMALWTIRHRWGCRYSPPVQCSRSEIDERAAQIFRLYDMRRTSPCRQTRQDRGDRRVSGTVGQLPSAMPIFTLPRRHGRAR
jgi:hypothetical protein